MKLSKKDKDNIAQDKAERYVREYSKAAPMILRLAARKAKVIIDGAKQKQL